jgi:cell division protein ZapD
VILYQYPFNERIRTYLRLEHLFFRLGELMGRSSPTDHHFAITTLFEIIEVGARAELKTDVLKDLEKQKHALAAYRGNPAISEEALEQVIGQLDACFTALKGQPGKPGHALTEIDWLMSLRSRASIPGGTCEFDLPVYHAWRHLEAGQRRADLDDAPVAHRDIDIGAPVGQVHMAHHQIGLAHRESPEGRVVGTGSDRDRG